MIRGRATVTPVCDHTVFNNPYFWAVISAAFLGFALAYLLRFRTPLVRRLTVAAFAVTFGIIAATAGVFISGPSTILDRTLLFYFLGATVFFGAGFRFPRTAGLAFVSVIAIGVSVLAFELRAWTRFAFDEPVFSFSARSQDESYAVNYRLSGDIVRRVYEMGTTPGFRVETLLPEAYWLVSCGFFRLHTDSAPVEPEGVLRSLPGWNHQVIEHAVEGYRELYTYEVALVWNGDTGRIDTRIDLVLPDS